MENQILDLGCGRGAKINDLEKRGKVTGIDISDEFIKNCQQLFPKSTFKVMDGLKLDFPKNSFDEIYCLDVIEHVNNPDLLLKNVGRVLRQKGTLHLDIPYYQSEKLLTTFNPTYTKQVHHQTTFTFSKIITLLNNNNFKIINCQNNKFFDNIYLLSYFLRNKKIQNQQGDFHQDNELDELLSFIIQHIYQPNSQNKIKSQIGYKKFNQISNKYFKLPLFDIFINLKLINDLISPFFPKTISLECQFASKPDNKISDLQPQNRSIDLSPYSTKTNINRYKNKINKVVKINKQLAKSVHELTNEINSIKDSQFFKLWPIYNKLKSIVK